MNRILLFGDDGGGNRPGPRPQASFLPFDPNDDYGEVHTTPPPEQGFTGDPAEMLADFGGVTIPGEYAWNGPPASAGSSVTITTGRWAGLVIPFLAGANSTPPTMLMTPMLPLYPAAVQFAFLSEYCERGYWDLVLSPEPWNAAENGYAPSPDKTIAFCRDYQASWGLRVVAWRGGLPPDDISTDAMIAALFDAGVVGYYIHGKEVDIQGYSRAEDYEASIVNADRYIRGRVPLGAHFSANAERGLGYPIGAPREYFLPDWSPYDGRLHLMHQGCRYYPTNAAPAPPAGTLCPAGLQGAAIYYARQHVNLGSGDAGRGAGAPNSRVVNFESNASSQLYGDQSEVGGVRRSWQIWCGTRSDVRIKPVAGSASGLWQPDGTPMSKAA